MANHVLLATFLLLDGVTASITPLMYPDQTACEQAIEHLLYAQSQGKNIVNEVDNSEIVGQRVWCIPTAEFRVRYLIDPNWREW